MTPNSVGGIDAMLDATVVGGYTRIGSAVRRRLYRWSPLDRLDGRVVAVTGATSGIGRAIAEGAAALGADVVLLVRDHDRGSQLAASIQDRHASRVDVFGVDLSDLSSVRDAAAALCDRGPLHALVHNAGGLSATRRITAAGDELTFATHVLGPYLLTTLTLPCLERATDPRVIVVTSGGMYAQPLDPSSFRDPDGSYRGSATYARCKRAQVSLVELHRQGLAGRGVTLVAYHPGWTDTAGLRSALPRFRSIMRPLLRTPEEGADTALWLLGVARADVEAATLFCDRAPRTLHRLASTARSDTPAARRALDALVRDRCGLGECAP